MKEDKTQNHKKTPRHYKAMGLQAVQVLAANTLHIILLNRKASGLRSEIIELATLVQYLEKPLLQKIHQSISAVFNKASVIEKYEVPAVGSTVTVPGVCSLVAWLDDEIRHRQIKDQMVVLHEKLCKLIVDESCSQGSENIFANVCGGLVELQDVLPLKDYQIGILGSYYILWKYSNIEVFNLLGELKPEQYDVILSRSLGISQHVVNKELGKNSPLRMFGLIINRDFLSRQPRFLGLSSELFDLLSSKLPASRFLNKVVRQYKGKPHAPDTFAVPDNKIDLMRRLLSRNAKAQILFYGAPGTGKTEFARTISQLAGRDVYEIKTQDPDEDNNRVSAYMLASVMTSQKKNSPVLVVDEADDILNTPFLFNKKESLGKAQLNELLDHVHVPTIWIVNHTGAIDSSVRRRFDFIMHFEKLPEKGIYNALQILIRRHKLSRFFNKEDLMKLAEKFSVTPGVFDRYLASLKECGGTNAEIRESLNLMLEEYVKFSGIDIESNLAKSSEVYDPGFTNCNPGLGRVLRYLQTVRQDFKNRDVRPGEGANILLHGPPGTGKTEFIRWLGKELDCKVVLKRGSDLMHPYVGMTEKLIAEMFREAKEPNTIVLVDEADSFFTKRENAEASWQVSHTNEFLNQMENHRGIVFYCTNFESNLDAASMRRFNWKVGFDYPDALQREGLILAYFDKLKPAPAELVKARLVIKNLEFLTAGDIAAVHKRTKYERGLTLADIIIELQSELKYKQENLLLNKKKIGF